MCRAQRALEQADPVRFESSEQMNHSQLAITVNETSVNFQPPASEFRHPGFAIKIHNPANNYRLPRTVARIKLALTFFEHLRRSRTKRSHGFPSRILLLTLDMASEQLATPPQGFAMNITAPLPSVSINSKFTIARGLITIRINIVRL